MVTYKLSNSCAIFSAMAVFVEEVQRAANSKDRDLEMRNLKVQAATILDHKQSGSLAKRILAKLNPLHHNPNEHQQLWWELLPQN